MMIWSLYFNKSFGGGRHILSSQGFPIDDVKKEHLTQNSHMIYISEYLANAYGILNK